MAMEDEPKLPDRTLRPGRLLQVVYNINHCQNSRSMTGNVGEAQGMTLITLNISNI